MVELRAGLGLRSDDAWIDQVEQSTPTVDPVWGIKLGPGEPELLEQRMAVQLAADPLLSSLDEEARRDLATVYIAPEPGGRLVLKFVRNVDEYRRRLTEQFPYPDRIEVGSAQHSIAALDALVTDIGEAVDELDVYVPFIARNDFENRVDVEVSGSAAAVERRGCQIVCVRGSGLPT